MRKTSRAVLLSATAAAAALLVSACSGGGGTQGAPGGAPGKDDKLSLTVYSNFEGREYKAVTEALNRIKTRFPNFEVKHEGTQDDEKITGAIRGGNPPDVAISFFTDNLGQFCSSGSFQNLQPYIDRDKADLNVIPKAVRDYTEYKGNRCSMPMLTDIYGFYFNKDMFAKAGITEPPKTTDALLEATKKLTEFNPDGSIKVAGFMPLIPHYRNQAQNWTPMFGARYLGTDGKSNLAASPEWKELFEFQKKLVDFYGYDKIEKFRAGLGQEYSADHAFQKGKLAMMIDGEYRTAFLANEAKEISYGTAPAPVSPSKPELYGGGFATGTIIGIPKGVKNPGASWELVKQMSLDTDTLVQLSNAIKNIPTTEASMKDPKLEMTPQFKTFIDIFGSGKLWSNPATPIGDAHLKAVNDFAEKWQAGKVTDLPGELKKVDAQVDDALAQKAGK
ncbi:extracellular solute-binding protein [Crossiella sp. CA198]|uniref:extracellular solute-binding protein n=1 Tax=Crossiella sp. CA198 TaxID=3455607 RepID=UPI003F8CF81E